MAAHQAPPSLGFSGKNTGVGCHFLLQCMKVKSEREVAQSCPTLHDPMDYSPPGSSVHGICQARALGWGAIARAPFIFSGFSLIGDTSYSFKRSGPADAFDNFSYFILLLFDRQQYYTSKFFNTSLGSKNFEG